MRTLLFCSWIGLNYVAQSTEKLKTFIFKHTQDIFCEHVFEIPLLCKNVPSTVFMSSDDLALMIHIKNIKMLSNFHED